MLAATAKGTAIVLKMSVLSLLDMALRLLLVCCKAYNTIASLGFRGLIEAIDKISRSRGHISSDLLGLAGRDVFLQPPQESGKLHGGRRFTYPKMRTGLQFFHIALYTKPRVLHEVCR